jgi:dihydrofolate reductase
MMNEVVAAIRCRLTDMSPGRTTAPAGVWGGRRRAPALLGLRGALPFFIATHRPEEQPDGGEFRFVSGVETAVDRAREAAGAKDVHIMGGADVIRQALDAGLVDELSIVVAPVILGAGKRLFEGFSQALTWSTWVCASRRSRPTSTTA